MFKLFLFCIWCPIIYSLHMWNGDIGIAHVEPVLNFRITGHFEGPDLIEHGHTQPHADEVQITFSAFNQDWDLDLVCNHEMFSHRTVFNFSNHLDPEDNHIHLPDHTLYLSKTREEPWASVNIYEDGTIHAMIITKNGTYTIDPIHEFPEFDLHSKMAIYHHDDLLHGGTLPDVSGAQRSLLQQVNPPITADGTPRNYPTTPMSRDETPIGGAPTKWANCYPGDTVVEQKFSMGMAVTGEYYLQVCTKGETGNALAKRNACANHLKNLLADSNTIYVPQMGVHLYIEVTDIQMGIDRGGPNVARTPVWNMAQRNAQAPANSGCGEDAGDSLGKLRAWRQTNHPNDAGLWHLMTTCFPAPGTVGIAYLNAICTARVGSGLSSSLSAGNPGSRAIWKVVAHEIGHNFGGGHSFELGQGTTGGIMDYGPGRLNGIYQFNSRFRQVPMCQLIAGRKANPQTASCFANYPASNGKQYGYALGAQATCPVTCLTNPPTNTIRPYECRECSVAPVNGLCTSPTGAVQNDDLCPGTKPNSVVQPCDPAPTAPCAASRCGDNRIDPATGEECDPPGPCCTQLCKIQTCTLNNDVDTCFNSVKTLKTFCFKGDQYNQYDPLTSKIAKAEGFPRPIAQYWPGLPQAFQSGGYDAIIQRKEGRVYFLKGQDYAVFEIGFGGHNGYPKKIDTNGGVNADGLFEMPTAWDKVDAAASLNSGQGGAYVFGTNRGTAATEYCRMSFDAVQPNRPDMCPATNPLTVWSGGDPFPLGKVGAAIRYWPELGARKQELNLAIDLIYQGKFVTFAFGEGTRPGAPTELLDFGTAKTGGTGGGGSIDPLAQACPVGCFDCTGNVNVCNTCDVDFELVSGKCYPVEYVVEMLFDNNRYNQDQQFVASTSVIESNWNTAEGNTNQAVVLKQTDYIKIDVNQIPSDMINWEFHFWVKINSQDASYLTKKINLVAGRLTHGSSNYDTSFFLTPRTNDGFTPVPGEWNPKFRVVKYNRTQSGTFEIVKTLDLQNDFTVKQGEWNHLIATLKRGNMQVTVDGGEITMPYDDESDRGQTESQWTFSAFEIGLSGIPAAKGKFDQVQFSGIEGLLDQFHVDALNSTQVNDFGHATTSYSCKLLFVFIAAISQMVLY